MLCIQAIWRGGFFCGSIFNLATNSTLTIPVLNSQRKLLTSFRTQGRIHQASLLVNAGNSLVAHALATLFHLPMSGPTFQWAGSWRALEDAIGPVPVGLGQKLMAGTRLGLLQGVRVLAQAEVLLLTATWEAKGKLLALANAPSAYKVDAKLRKLLKVPKATFHLFAFWMLQCFWSLFCSQ